MLLRSVSLLKHQMEEGTVNGAELLTTYESPKFDYKPIGVGVLELKLERLSFGAFQQCTTRERVESETILIKTV